MSSTRVRLGLTLDDLEGIYGGELCLAVIQPENDINQHATVLLVDVTGHVEQVDGRCWTKSARICWSRGQRSGRRRSSGVKRHRLHDAEEA